MTNKSPSLANVIAALPAVQAAIRDEIAARIAAGDVIASLTNAELHERSRAVLAWAGASKSAKKTMA